MERFQPRMLDAVEARVLQSFRWWHVSELAATSEPLSPRSLHAIVTSYLAHGAPPGPLEVEVLVD